MTDIASIRQRAQHFSVLYVEDEETIRKQMSEILGEIFHTVYVACDGKEGLEVFTTNKPDIVITDIQMPAMNGLDMSKQIKELSPQTPILVTTAFSDQNYFLNSIEIGIDRYILKPILPHNFFASLISVIERVEGRRAAKELEEKKVKEQLNKVAADMMSKVANAFPSPALVICDDEIRFMNQAFFDMLDAKRLQQLAEKKITIDDLLEKRDGYISSFSECSLKDFFLNKVSIRMDEKRAIFLVAASNIELDAECEKAVIYSLSNITSVEYQKQKNKHYAEVLQELLFTHYRPSTQAQLLKSASKPLQEMAREIIEEESQAAQQPKKFLLLTEDEQRMLRRSHTVKSDAMSYTAEIEGNVLDEMAELSEIESELLAELEQLQYLFEMDSVLKIADRLKAYSNTVTLLFEFADLAQALESLSLFLRSISNEALEGRARDKLTVYLASICMDLITWRTSIFVEKSARDIHYLDSSLFSSCLQLQLALSTNDTTIDDEDDLELF